MWAPEPLPMLGQLWVEPVPDPELEPEPEDVLDEPELVLGDPEFPVPVLDDGVVVDELEVSSSRNPPSWWRSWPRWRPALRR